ncbi:MAG: bifunctional diaminohydroxyphosphoribosylaminopyrimidine deaminase/5-amino-6-(5-phosphoribosylamino)uracil reductase RibD [Acidobacteriota bacterium]
MLTDDEYIHRALELAARARGRTTPNPMVGALVVAPDGTVVGHGYHARAGEPHAEVHALDEAGAAARGATLYCTLEPCCHTGRTPPCAPRIVDAGIRRVVASVEDPNPQVAGGGVRLLREHGIEVRVGPGRDDALRLNRPFFSAVRRKRPFVMVKAAVSLDGRIAAAGGERARLTSARANRRSQSLRAEVDAVGVGSGTVLADDPLLTAREVYRVRPLVRVVFDRRLRVSPNARLFGTADQGPIVIATRQGDDPGWGGRREALEQAGARMLVARDAGLLPILEALTAGHDVQSLLLEGGAALHAAAAAEGLVDAVRVIVAPRVLGPHGVPWVRWPRLSAAGPHSVEPCGPDVIIDCDVHWTD